jgi:hypothetical protein
MDIDSTEGARIHIDKAIDYDAAVALPPQAFLSLISCYSRSMDFPRFSK